MTSVRLPPELDAPRAWLEDELRRSVAGEDPMLTEVSVHLIEAGGHRWRPSLALMSALAGGTEITEDIVRGACAVELVHLGSLYHDDVMDDASSRRGVVSVNARWGNLIAILGGDFLLARASEIAAALGTEVAGLLAHTIGRLCEGQILEIKAAFDVSRSEDAYLASIDGKTGSLMAAACRIGGLCAGLSTEQVDALTAYGAAFGRVFQIVDDVSDFVFTTAELGKPTAQDIPEGVYTLPVIRALALPEIGDSLRAALTAKDHDAARQIVLRSGGIDSAIKAGREWADAATSELRMFADSPARAGLEVLPGALLDGLPC